MDRKTEIIYKKFQFKLKLSYETIEHAKKLHKNLLEKSPFKYESSYLIVAICIFTVSRIENHPKSLKEIGDVSHIKEEDLKKCFDMVFSEIKNSLKSI